MIGPVGRLGQELVDRVQHRDAVAVGAEHSLSRHQRARLHTADMVELALVVPFNDLAVLERVLTEHAGQVAGM